MSEADLVAYRRKVVLASVAVVAAVAAVSSVLLVECFADGACGVGYIKGSGSSINNNNGFIGGAGGGGGGGGGDSTVDFLGSWGGWDGGGGLFSDEHGAASFGDGALSVGGGGGGGGGVHGDLFEESATFSAPAAVGGGLAGEEEESMAVPEVAAVMALAAAAVAPAEADAVFARNGTSHRRDCNSEWCYSRSLMGLWEWLLLLLEAGFCIALRHDLAPATAGVGVESFVL